MSNYGNSFQKTNPAVLNLIIINALVFLVQKVFDGGEQLKITSLLVLYPFDSELFKPYQLVSAIFAHADFMHLLFNMFALWVFGTTLERVWGPKKFLIFYMICGIAAGIVSAAFGYAGLGASGAIMGLMGAFAYLFPNTQFIIFPVPFPIKAKYMVMIIAALDLIGVFSPMADQQIGYLAHIGGLVMGLIIVIIWNKTNKKTFY